MHFIGWNKPEEYIQRPLPSLKVTVWAAVSTHGVTGLHFIEDNNGNTITVNTLVYREQIIYRFKVLTSCVFLWHQVTQTTQCFSYIWPASSQRVIFFNIFWRMQFSWSLIFSFSVLVLCPGHLRRICSRVISSFQQTKQVGDSAIPKWNRYNWGTICPILVKNGNWTRYIPLNVYIIWSLHTGRENKRLLQ